MKRSIWRSSRGPSQRFEIKRKGIKGVHKERPVLVAQNVSGNHHRSSPQLGRVLHEQSPPRHRQIKFWLQWLSANGCRIRWTKVLRIGALFQPCIFPRILRERFAQHDGKSGRLCLSGQIQHSEGNFQPGIHGRSHVGFQASAIFGNRKTAIFASTIGRLRTQKRVMM